MNALVTHARSANLQDMIEVLRDQQTRKIDVVAPASRLKFKDAQLQLSGLDPVMDLNGVTDPNGLYRPTDVFDEGLASKLNIPLAYVRRMRLERPTCTTRTPTACCAGRRSRGSSSGCSRPTSGSSCSARSRRRRRQDRPRVPVRLHGIMDHLDILTAAFGGIQRPGGRCCPQV
jgi:hypothetical protein